MTDKERHIDRIMNLGNRRPLRMSRSVLLLLLCTVCAGTVLQSGCSSRSAVASSHRVQTDTRYSDSFGRDMEIRQAANAESAEGAPAFAPPEALSADEPEIDPGQTERLVVYNAVINVVVERISDSLSRIRAAAVEMGGYMQEMSGESITLKIPAGRFNEAIAEVEKLGEVTRKEIKGSDVTEQMRDLNIRLRNAEQVREKLLNLLERAGDVDDALKVEKELERITEKIELLKGKIAYLRDKVAFCTLTVIFNSPIPQEDITTVTPFAWVHDLGAGLTKPFPRQPRKRWSLLRPSMFKPPQDYIKYYEDRDEMKAMSAAGVAIEMHKWKNYKGGSVGFWGDLVRRVLVEEKVFHIEQRPEARFSKRAGCALFQASKQIGSRQYGYLVVLGASKKNLYVLEAWGPMQEFEKDRSKLEKAVASMRLR